MKKFTEKQIETFVQRCNDGMIKHLCECGYVNILRKIARTLIENDNGDIINSEITINEIVSMFDERRESFHLIEELINSFDKHSKVGVMNRLVSDYKQYIPKQEITRKTMIDLLGLRDFATKEEILKELNEIL